MKKYALIILTATLALSGCTDTSAEKVETTAAETETTSKFLEPSYSQTKKENKSYRGHTPVSDYVDDSDYLDEFDMYYVESTCFDEIGYNYYDETLYLRFLDSQKEYLYLDVPEYVFDELYDSDSPGRYYNREIKGQYKCERLFD